MSETLHMVAICQLYVLLKTKFVGSVT